LHNPIISSKRHGDVVSAGVGRNSRIAGNGLEGVVKYNRQMRLGLFVLAFACFFGGLDEVVYDLKYTKEFWKQGNVVSAKYELVLKQWAREHHL
jgi:hypothetical protein